MPYFEDLINCGVCPHVDATVPDGIKVYFRVVKENPATSECFLPTAPRKDLLPPDPCIAKAVSIYDSIDALKNGYSRNPTRKKERGLIATIILKPCDGMVKQTFSAGHYSWWRTKEFDHTAVTVQILEPETNN